MLNKLNFYKFNCFHIRNNVGLRKQLVSNLHKIKPTSTNNENMFDIVPLENNIDWGHKYFDSSQDLKLPVLKYDLINYNNKFVTLSHSIFNNFIRKDLIYRVYRYNTFFNLKTTAVTKDKSMVSGSGKKPFRQKGTGRARQGNIRSPNLRKGGHTFPLTVRSKYYPLSKKVRLAALKSILTSKLVENKIIVLEKFGFNKMTERISQVLKSKFCMVLNDEDYKKMTEKNEQKSIFGKPLHLKTVNVKNLIENNFLIFDLKSIKEFQNNIADREKNYYRITKKFKDSDEFKTSLPLEFEKQLIIKNTDPYKKLHLLTPALRGSYKNIMSSKINPEELKTKFEGRLNQRIKAQNDHYIKKIEAKQAFSNDKKKKRSKK